MNWNIFQPDMMQLLYNSLYFNNDIPIGFETEITPWSRSVVILYILRIMKVTAFSQQHRSL